ncbi:retinoblastoma-like protein 2 isoform X2 [Mugil cephalus]|uniref:retinoblastoma-like protein 2 isoform X2 n=1 Tax=Mugil cephalus TaxID=48193 RepID=UPI001FB6920F|nr:retinoblastoma-like protein 2 isoform X2 [Mugil cephalus]
MATGPQDDVGKPRAFSRDLTGAVETRLKRMLQMFLQHHRDDSINEKTKECAAKCSCEAGIWYYRILENLIGHERKRLGVRNISGILENDLFQCSLVACCLEIAITTNQLPGDFPRLLQIIKLTPHPFWKVIEPVLRVAVDLPLAVIRHLGQVEERVLESLAWTSNSPLWGEIRANEGRLPACQQVMLHTQLEDPLRGDLQSDQNILGMDDRSGADLSASIQQQRSPVSRAERSSSLYLFARNVYSLMGRRLRELCSVLDITDELRLKIWTCFEYSLIHCTHLMRDRHLDQLLMCAIYIMAKITKMEIPFKRIMERYKSQPHVSKSVCKNVLISEVLENSPNGNGAIPTPNTPSTHYPEPCQERRGNLIYFYNQVYTTKMQHFAKQFASTSVGDTPLSPYPRQQKASPHRRRLSSSLPIYVSSYNTEMAAPHTPTLCYYFNSSQSERLREINNMIKTGQSPSCQSYAASEDEKEEEEGGDGPSAKRLRLDGQSAWQRRLRNVANERVPRRHQDHVRPLPVVRPNLH